MTLKQYLIVMALGTAIAAATVGLLVWLVDPFQTGAVAVVIFLSTLGLTLAGILAIFGVIIRVYLFRHYGLIVEQVRVSLRQATFVSLLVILALVLSHYHLFAWWNMTFAVALLVALEYFFLSHDLRQRDEAPIQP